MPRNRQFVIGEGKALCLPPTPAPNTLYSPAGMASEETNVHSTSLTCLHCGDELKQMRIGLRDRYHSKMAGGSKLEIRLRPKDSSPVVGEFVVLPPAKKLVGIFLYPARATPPNPFQLLCTLCHELGHWRSWASKQRSPGWEEAHLLLRGTTGNANSMLSEKQKLLIYEEELRAWRYAYDFATEVGFTDKRSFVGEADRALGFYREMLQLSEEPSPFSLA